MKIVHFDVDEEIKKYLKEEKYSFSLSKINLDKILKKDLINVISLKSQSTVNKNILSHLPNLKLIVSRTVGVDHIDLEACERNRVTVKNITDYGARNVAEHALALLLAGARNIVQANEQVHQGIYSYRNFLGTSFKDKTLGVIGTGRIGMELIRLMKGFELKIICYDVMKNIPASRDLNFSYVDLNFLLKNSDFISLHLPLLKSTHHLLTAKLLELMKPGVILVNTSRGEIVDEKALITNIKNFKAICLDVIENEGKFDRYNSLLKYKNVIITPHTGFFTDDSVKTIAFKTSHMIKYFFTNNI